MIVAWVLESRRLRSAASGLALPRCGTELLFPAVRFSWNSDCEFSCLANANLFSRGGRPEAISLSQAIEK